MAPVSKDQWDWDWDPMLVASGLFTARNIDHHVIGSAAIQYHGYQSACDPGEKPAGNPPWKFTNNFEVSIPDEKMSEARDALLNTRLFEVSSGDNCDTMYEGTGTLFKLQAKWSKPTVVNLILLPKTAYFPLPPERHVAPPRERYPLSSGRQGDERLKKLPFPIWKNLVLSLVYRAVVHDDQMARRSFARLRPEMAQDSTWSASVPDHWEAEVREAASDMLERRWYRRGGDESTADLGGDLNRPQYGQFGLFGGYKYNPFAADVERPVTTPPRQLAQAHGRSLFGSSNFAPNNNTTADTRGVDADDLLGRTLINISGEAEGEEEGSIAEEVTVAETLDQTADGDSQHGRSDGSKKRKTRPDGDVHDGV